MIVLWSNCLLLKCWVSFEFLSVLCETFIDIWIKLLSIKGNVLNFPTRNVLTSWFWNKFKNTKCKIKKKTLSSFHELFKLQSSSLLFLLNYIDWCALWVSSCCIKYFWGFVHFYSFNFFFCHLALASQQKQFSDPNMEYLSCGRSNFWKDE